MFRLACCVMALLAACGTPIPTSNQDPVIAQVASQSITQSLYTLRLNSALASVSQAGGPTQNAQMQTQLSQAVFRSTILDAVLAQLAHNLNLYPSPQAISEEVAADAAAASGTPGLMSQAAEAGTSLAGVQDEVRSRLTEQAVEDHAASQRADYVYTQLQAKTDFATLAKQFSDDSSTATNGGDLGVITPTQLAATSKFYQDSINALSDGGSVEIREAAGYDIVMLDGADVSGKHLSHILIQAPKPYTVRERPGWFQQSIVSQLFSYCQSNQVAVYLANMPSPCASAAPTGTPS